MAEYINDSEHVKMFADSFGSPQYFRCDQLENGTTLAIAPHRIVLDREPDVLFKVGFDNCSAPGMSMRGFILRKRAVIRAWAERLPRVTIIQLGAIDVNNNFIGESDKPGKAYCDYVFKFLDDIIEIGESHLANDEAENFRVALRTTHRFLMVGLSDWGPNFNPKYETSLTPEQYKKARRKYSSAMDLNRRRLWNSYKGVLFTPMLSHPERNNMHLAPHESTKYAEQILAVCAKLTCTYCRITMSNKFNKIEHTADVLKQGTCVGDM